VTKLSVSGHTKFSTSPSRRQGKFEPARSRATGHFDLRPWNSSDPNESSVGAILGGAGTFGGSSSVVVAIWIDAAVNDELHQPGVLRLMIYQWTSALQYIPAYLGHADHRFAAQASSNSGRSFVTARGDANGMFGKRTQVTGEVHSHGKPTRRPLSREYTTIKSPTCS
jgi:hypothetical protein